MKYRIRATNAYGQAVTLGRYPSRAAALADGERQAYHLDGIGTVWWVECNGWHRDTEDHSIHVVPAPPDIDSPEAARLMLDAVRRLPKGNPARDALRED